MELGKGKLRKVGINNLHTAVHPSHGVVWTDGKAIYLAPLQVKGHQLQDASSIRLGEFENVVSVHWSRVSGGEPCYLCVVHEDTVTVWRVSGHLPALSFKQVRKINVKVIPQGCLWNPVSDVVCLLSRQQCSFYFRHDHNKASYAFPSLESGKISCGCWSPDGLKLVLCVGSALLIYRWADASIPVSQFTATAWRIPGLEGHIRSIAPVLHDSVVVATELPLESLCRQHDSLVTPDLSADSRSADDILRPTESLTQGLLNLQPNPKALSDASSSLTLVNLQDGKRDPIKLSSGPLKGVLSPDILLYECSSQCVVVGSNSQSQLHIYALLDKHLAYCGDIQLEKAQRPKGLCSMPTYFDDRGAALLILVGQRGMEDTSFLSSATGSEFDLSLKYIIVKAGYSHKSRHNGHGDGQKTKTAGAGKNLVKSESMKEHRIKHLSDAHLRARSGSVKKELARESSPESIVRLPPVSPTEEEPGLDPQSLLKPDRVTSLGQQAKMIEDLSDSSDPPPALETESVSFSAQAPKFDNSKLEEHYKLDKRSRDVELRHQKTSGRSSPRRSLPDSQKKSSDRKPEVTTVGILKNSPTRQKRNKDSAVEDTQLLPTQTKENTPPHGEQSRLSQDLTLGELEPRCETGTQAEAAGAELATLAAQETPEHDSKPCSRPQPIHGRLSNTAVNSLGDYGQDAGKEEELSDQGLGSSHHSADSNFDSMERQVRLQRETIEALQKRLEELSTTVKDSCCVFPTKYQDMESPEMIEIECERPEGMERKRFLLDNGRLQLDTIKLAFSLATVELWLDGIPCVLGANIDGYIPMKFSSHSKLHISGIPADPAHGLETP